MSDADACQLIAQALRDINAGTVNLNKIGLPGNTGALLQAEAATINCDTSNGLIVGSNAGQTDSNGNIIPEDPNAGATSSSPETEQTEPVPVGDYVTAEDYNTWNPDPADSAAAPTTLLQIQGDQNQANVWLRPDKNNANNFSIVTFSGDLQSFDGSQAKVSQFESAPNFGNGNGGGNSFFPKDVKATSTELGDVGFAGSPNVMIYTFDKDITIQDFAAGVPLYDGSSVPQRANNESGGFKDYMSQNNSNPNLYLEVQTSNSSASGIKLGSSWNAAGFANKYDMKYAGAVLVYKISGTSFAKIDYSNADSYPNLNSVDFAGSIAATLEKQIKITPARIARTQFNGQPGGFYEITAKTNS